MGDDLTTALVTGAAGYLGSHVLRMLRARGIDAIGVARSPTPGLLACDLSDPLAASGLLRDLDPGAVVHCAASVPGNAQEYTDAAIGESNLRMVKAVLQAGPRKMVFASSMTVYPPEVSCAREQDAVSSGNGYAASKLEAEALLLGQSGASVAILRLPGLFGPPRRGGVLFNAALAFAQGRSFQIAGPAPRWSALHVEDAAETMIRALRLPGASQVINVGYAGRMAISDAVAQLARLFSRDWPAPAPVWFEFDLTRLHRSLGALGNSFQSRLRQIADWAREAALEIAHD